MPLIVTNPRGVTYAVPNAGHAEAEAAMQKGYIWIAPTMVVSTHGVQIDVLPGA